MSCVNLHRVKAGLHREPYSIAIGLHHEIDVLLFHLSVEGGGVEIESVDCSHRSLSASAPVGHIPAVTELDACLRSFCVNRVRDPLELRNNLFAHPKLRVEADSALTHSSISDGRHSNATARHSPVVVEKFLGRGIVLAHPLERRRTYRPVPQFNRSELIRSKYLTHIL